MIEIIILIIVSFGTAFSLGLLILKLVDKKHSEEKLLGQKDDTGDLKLYFQKEYGDLKVEMTKLFGDYSKVGQGDLNAFKDKMMSHIDLQLRQINDKVEQRLGLGFEKSEKTFHDVVERLAKIDEAQKKIETLSQEVVSLNSILTDKKNRGIFGEVQLYQLLSSVLGDHKALYEKQKRLSNESIADAVLNAPQPLGMIAIDSKFPLDNYKKMVDRTLGDADRKMATKTFKTDVKKHIDDIKNKYIIFNETSDQAIMFIPAEAIFAELIAYHEDLIDYAHKNKVWVTSPTTLISTLTMIQMIVKNMERDEQAQLIINELMKLGEEFKRYHERWDKLKRSIDSVSKDADRVHITSQKISTKFRHISDAKFDELDIETEDLNESEDLEEND